MKDTFKYYRIFSNNNSEFFHDTYNEVDINGWTNRVVEIKSDGSKYFADKIFQVGQTFLPEASIFPLSQIENSGFLVKEITENDFEEKWDLAIIFAKNNKLKPLLTGVIY